MACHASGPLRGIRVLEFAGLAPGPYCGLILADFGADVIRVDRLHGGAGPVQDPLCRGKRSLAVDMKQDEGIKLLLRILKQIDVLIDPFRPGVMERLGLGPSVVMASNPRIIYARLTGWGQTGPYSKVAGHDINYIGLSGALSLFARKGENPLPPVNILGDFAGGGMLCATGILLALFEREKSGKGQVIDSAMVDGTSHLITFIHKFRSMGLWNDEPGTNTLDSGAPFYDTYRCADGRFMAVGAIEPQFYRLLLKGLGLAEDDLPAQLDMEEWPILREKFKQIFGSKPRSHWEKVFDGTDACVTPVLTMEEAPTHPHNQARAVYGRHPTDSSFIANPAPRLSRTPGRLTHFEPSPGQQSTEVLRELGLSASEISELLSRRIIRQDLAGRLTASKL